MSISAGALVRLASAFRLGRAERAYLFELAAQRDPEPSESRTEVVSPAMLACVDLIAAPAYVLDRAWTARSWNARARHLFVGLAGRNGRQEPSALHLSRTICALAYP